MRLNICFLALILAGTSSNTTAQQAEEEQVLEPARIRCNAAYSTPCSRTNSHYLAVDTARKLQDLDPLDYLADITAGKYNMTVGFYPFAFRRGNSTLCVAHGADATLVGLTLEEIFTKNKIGFSNAQALHQRFELAASQQDGNWVTYLWSDGGDTNSKVAYVTALNEDYMIGVGYEDVQLPPDVPCSAKFDGWCSIDNVRSLVGKAQFSLYEASSSLELFESVAFDMSFLPDAYQIPGEFYTFMYNFDGSLKAHAKPRFHEEFGSTFADIFFKNGLGTRQEGQNIHEAFVRAAEGNGWVSYPWRDSLTSEPYAKIAKLVKVEFEDDAFYVGAGFNFATDLLPTGPLGEGCTAATNLPCAFSTAFQLSSHALAFAISSTDSVSEIFTTLTYSPEFKTENADFYIFTYNYNEVCQSHGSNPDFVGMTLSDVFDLVGNGLDGTIVHEQFLAAAEQGGGFVKYDWIDAQGNPFEKISYIFSMNLDGEDYYGGIGLNHVRAPVQEFTESGTKENGEPILCSSEFGWDCSEVNARAIEGQALADLTLYSSNLQQASLQRTVSGVLTSITAKDDLYRVNEDFTVSVFAGDQSGSCVASGAEPAYVGKTWQEILDVQGITSIRGPELHRQLLNKANGNGGVVEYAFSTGTDAAKRKRAWTSRFRSEGELYYVVAEYFTTDPPPTCDAGECPASMECTSDDQAFCEVIPEPSENPIDTPMAKVLIALTCLALLIALCAWCFQRRKTRRAKDALRREKEENDRLVKQFEQQMQGVFEVKHDLLVQSAAEYREKQAQKQERAFWYWEENASHIESHKSSMILAGTNFVRYSRDISDMIEHSFQLHEEGRGFPVLHMDVTDKISSTADGNKATGHASGMEYDLDFASLTQKNSKTKYERNVCRKESDLDDDVVALGCLPVLPADLSHEDENLLPTYKGQVIQVSKVHRDGEWQFGNVLDDPLLNAAKEKDHEATTSLDAMLAHALHERAMSGWFPKCVAEPADHSVMQRLIRNIGGEGVDGLTPPNEWTHDTKGSSVYAEGHVDVPFASNEYNKVASAFTERLYGKKHSITVTQVQRIQNLPLWQSYAVKRQTIKKQYAENQDHRVNNKGEVERQLFHGTSPDIIHKIEKQGFNRSFAGRNAVRYGKGVYFARDSAYSCHKAYSAQDEHGIQRMFVCQVVVGDWSKGENEQLAPDPKPENPFELYDTTVDNVTNPSIFVVYHDSQCYPSYLVSFQSS